MHKFKLTICAFTLKGGKVWWCDEWINDVAGWTVRGRRWGKSFGKGGPHATSTSRAEGDVGMAVLGSEDEFLTELYSMKAEDVLCAR